MSARLGSAPTACGGGATAVAKAKVQRQVIKRHGRWASGAVYLYIVEGVEEQLGVPAAVLE